MFVGECPIDKVYGFYIPNAFTSNDDGINDNIGPISYNVSILEFSISNRWSYTLFETQNGLSWNGKFQNKDCPLGIYIYKVSYRDVNNIARQKTGRIALIR